MTDAERYIEALTPSVDTKAEYIGEFSFYQELFNPENDYYYAQKFIVPWTTIKEIMCVIKDRAENSYTLSDGG